jgi:hypothetical protein
MNLPVIQIGFVGFASIIAFRMWRTALAARREHFIRAYVFPPGLFKRLQSKRPELTFKDCNLVAQALRHFFLAYLRSRKRFVSMPSQAVDDLWHEFILYTRNYQGFCSRAFGTFLHHSPAAVLGRQRQPNEGLRRVWWFACKEENLDPRRPSRLPLLFAIDTKLNIGDGFHYVPDCEAIRREERSGMRGSSSTPAYCGGDFSSSSFDGTTDGFGDGDSGGSHGDDSGSNSSDGHSGCSGHGCGGGGCGGGGD